ncbi:hypothetical protein SESBI_15154 [Sesbania bispinosa]|nr:hypothetical protein SESBI_15154 [Sesbania bispinosa]
MVPTIEEYGLVVRLLVKEKEVVYQYKGRYVDEKKIAKLIGLLPNQLKFEKKGSILGLRRTFLEDRLKVLAEQGHWKHFKITLKRMEPTRPGYPRRYFPFYDGMPSKERRVLRCCSHMLYVWIMTHLYARHTMGPSPDPLRDFDSVPTKDFDARGVE